MSDLLSAADFTYIRDHLPRQLASYAEIQSVFASHAALSASASDWHDRHDQQVAKVAALEADVKREKDIGAIFQQANDEAEVKLAALREAIRGAVVLLEAGPVAAALWDAHASDIASALRAALSPEGE